MPVAELIAGALLGVAFQELWKAVSKAKPKNSSIKPALARLESTLKPIISRLDEIKRLNNKLNIKQSDMVDELVAIINNGKALVDKCSKIRSSDERAAKYYKQLVELDDSIARYFAIILPLFHFQETKKLGLETKKLGLEIKKIFDLIIFLGVVVAAAVLISSFQKPSLAGKKKKKENGNGAIYFLCILGFIIIVCSSASTKNKNKKEDPPTKNKNKNKKEDHPTKNKNKKEDPPTKNKNKNKKEDPPTKGKNRS